jgi:hypothetical protein
MPLAPPIDSTAGTRDPRQGAETLFRLAAWIYRRCNEITAEVRLDVIKIYDLAANCERFVAEADTWMDSGSLARVTEALVASTREAGIGGPEKTRAEIEADYKGLYAAASAFEAWARANLPGAGTDIPTSQDPLVHVNRSWPNPDMTVTVNKSPAVQARIDALRSIFV